MTDAAAPVAAPNRAAARRPLRRGVAVWARIGLLSFGGPAGQIALMHRIVVEERRWIGEPRFLHALNFCMLLPGPEAQQLATYLGWLMHGTKGGSSPALLFVLPGLARRSWRSASSTSRSGDVPLVDGAVLRAARRGARDRGARRWCASAARAARAGAAMAIAAAAFVAIFLFDVPFPLIVLAAALRLARGAGSAPDAFAPAAGTAAGTAAASPTGRRARRAGPHRACRGAGALAPWLALCAGRCWLGPVALLVLARADDVFTDIAGSSQQMAVVTFGGAYAVLAYVAAGGGRAPTAGSRPAEMLDGLGMAETTPGPLILVRAVRRLPRRLPRSRRARSACWPRRSARSLVTWVTFAPCFLWIFLGAPYRRAAARQPARWRRRLPRSRRRWSGVILNLALWFGLHVLFEAQVPVTGFGLDFELPVLASVDPWALALSALALFAVFRLRLGLFAVIGGAAAAGVALRLAGLVGAGLRLRGRRGKPERFRRTRSPTLSARALTFLAWAAAAACVAPILAAVATAMAGDLSTWRSLAATVLPLYVANTLALVALVAVGAAAVGAGAAWLVTAYRFPFSRALEILLVLPLAFPAYVLAYAYTDLLSHSGAVQSALRAATGWGPRDYWFPNIRSLPGAALMFVCVLYPYVYLLARAAFAQQSATAYAAARTLGRSPFQAFLQVSLPMARPAIAAGVLLVMMETLADYGTVAHFNVRTFSTGIYQSWISMQDRAAAAQLALCLLAFALLVAGLERAQRGAARAHMRGAALGGMEPGRLTGARGWTATAFCLAPVLVGFLIPLVVLGRMAVVSGGHRSSRATSASSRIR